MLKDGSKTYANSTTRALRSSWSVRRGLLGNKADLVDEREVTVEEAEQYAVQEKIFFMEVSALTNKDDKVFKAFNTVVEGRMLGITIEIVKCKETETEPETQQKPSQDTSQPVKINAVIAIKSDQQQDKKKSGCC